MRTPTHKLLCSLLSLLLVVAASQAVARDHSGSYHSRSYGTRAHSGYSHNHSYPARGYSTYHLPRGYYTSRYYGSPYYYHSGSWYRPYGPRYVVVAPPFGIGISVLPPFYTTLWYGGSPYYYADNTYYSYRSERREYVVTEPPRGEVAASAGSGTEEVFVYPKNGQSEDQQATDRYECHRWAVDKTGFDPTRSSGNVGGTEITTKRADYRRAEGACLDARGYSVK